MMSGVRAEIVGMILKVQLVEPLVEQKPRDVQYGAPEKGERKTAPAKVVKVGRNDPCQCGSGKKYKKCCLTK